MKKIFAFFVVFALIFALSACSCSHETWVDGESGKVCESCEISYCEVNGHSWIAATCENAKTCENCALTEGEALGHNWTEADCENAKTCETCKAVEGEALGHSWLDATTEAPKTCEVCSLTEGERIITDERFKTDSCSMVFGKWEGIVELPGDDFEEGFGKYLEVFPCVYTVEFTNDGKMSMKIGPADEEQFFAAMVEYTKDYLYSDFAASGIDKETADALFPQVYGTTIHEYVENELRNMGIDSIFEAMSFDFVYYIDGETMFLGLDWNYMEPDTFSFDGETLYLPIAEGQDPVAFTRVTE